MDIKDYRFLFFNTNEQFESVKDDISEDAIVFVKEGKKIYTHKTEYCVAEISNTFGDDDNVTISQKAITEAINRIWYKINDILGENSEGVEMTVTPTYFANEDGCTVHIIASSDNAAGEFEHIAFYANDELITEADNVDTFEYDTIIHDTTIIKCIATILGKTYTKEETIHRYTSFYVGAGRNIADIIIPENIVQITDTLRTTKDITVNDNDFIYVVLSESLSDILIRLDMNGFEIPLRDAETITYEGNNYKMLKSVNQYKAGTYNIDING